MGANLVEAYEGNTLVVTCTIISGLDDLDGYTSYLTVYDSQGVQQFEVTGSIAGLVCTFIVSNTQNQITAGDYKFECSLTNGTYDFTVTRDIYRMLKSDKYLP